MTLSRLAAQAWREAARQPLPPAVERAARLHLLDAVGVGLAAGALAQGSPWRRFAASATGGTTPTLAGIAVADPAEAALIDGGLIHSLEYDDTHTASIIHGSAALAPTALHVARAFGAAPDAAVRSYALAYETLIRFGLAALGAFQRQGFHVTSVAGALGAAMLAADLMGLGEEGMVNACGIALSQAAGVFEFLTNGASVKAMHTGWAAHAGIMAARLAAAGLTGPETALEGSRGLYAAYARDGDAPARLASGIADLGTRWHMPDVAFKFVPCCHYLHPFVEAAGQLLVEEPRAARGGDFVLRIASGAAPIVCEPWADKLAPRDGHAIRWSLPVVVAARLIEGRVDHGTFAKPPSAQVLALAARCRWEPLGPHRFPQAFEAEIVWRGEDGTTRTVRIDDVYGNAARPASEADISAKFEANAALALGAADAALLKSFLLEPGRVDFSAYVSVLGRIKGGRA